MNSTSWQAACTAAKIDPAEVRQVADRYAAYARFMGSRGGGLTLEQWFAFYRMEKSAEAGAQAGEPVGGCSAEGEPGPSGLLAEPEQFLDLLRLCLAAAPDPGRAQAGSRGGS